MIFPIIIPVPKLIAKAFTKLLVLLRIKNKKDSALDLHDMEKTGKVHKPRIKLYFANTPVLVVFLLWAMTAIDASVIREGIAGSEGIKPLHVMALFISLVRYSGIFFWTIS